ncbi:helix-turn-helix domain-containing protein [Zooshikella ganghwensis]|uniref:helix-turn-helix domain-containing protein n=1 Tax=Zooshikella ganghwensis TaxID=202772 RepID=UPI0004094BC0|nr:helix-turn-helix transcriptional regulator [Zooshikella ganghwensis]
MQELELWEKIRNSRIETGLTQIQFAQRVGVSRATASRWESEDPSVRRGPRVEHLHKIAEVTGKDLKYFLPPNSKRVTAAKEAFIKLQNETQEPDPEQIQAQIQEKLRTLTKDFMDLVIDGKLREVEIDLLQTLVSSIKNK